MTTPVTGRPFCQHAWSSTADLQEQLVRHPFNEALAAGTLLPSRFAYYLIQDSRYLKSFSATLAEAGRRSSDERAASFFTASAQRALAVEAALHAGYLSTLVSPGVADTVATSDACHAYTAFLARAATEKPYPLLVAALLPCFWVYQHVGERIMTRTAGQPDHPYRTWIDTYADASFTAAVDEIKSIADREAESVPEHVPGMLAIFQTATEHEHAFWDAAWAATPPSLDLHRR